MKFARRRLLLALPFAGMAVTWPGAVSAMAGDAMARLMNARLKQQGVGLVVVQVDGERRIEITAAGRGYDTDTIAHPNPLRDDALFEIGSITKTFTALLLADAVLAKTLALTDAVEDVLPGIPLRDSQGQPIRWIDLATHRSGMPRLPDNMAPRAATDPYDDYDDARLLTYLRSFKATRPRDTQWLYSNLGFGLIGYALARVAKQSYPALLTQRVLQPLGLSRTAFSVTGRGPIAGLVDGHDAQGRAVPHWHLDALMGAGALVMDGTDLGRYAQAALGVRDTPLRDAFALAQREHANGASPGRTMGLAWNRVSFKGRTLITHGGNTAGFSSSLWLDPDRRRASVVLANALVEIEDLALHVLDDSVPTQDFSLTHQTDVVIAAEQLAPLVGGYAATPTFKIVVTLRDGELWAQATGQGPFQLFAKDAHHFFAKVTPLEIDFDDGSPAAAFTLRQSGQEIRFKRP